MLVSYSIVMNCFIFKDVPSPKADVYRIGCNRHYLHDEAFKLRYSS